MLDYVVCPHCFRVYKRSMAALKFECKCCPFGDCDGSLVLAQPWQGLRSKYHKLPVLPQIGARYDLETGNKIIDN